MISLLGQRCHNHHRPVAFEFAPRDFKRRLIFLLLDYLWHSHDQLPDDFRELVDELTLLIMWLEKIEERI
jgi:hypothetical protein